MYMVHSEMVKIRTGGAQHWSFQKRFVGYLGSDYWVIEAFPHRILYLIETYQIGRIPKRIDTFIEPLDQVEPIQTKSSLKEAALSRGDVCGGKVTAGRYYIAKGEFPAYQSRTDESGWIELTFFNTLTNSFSRTLLLYVRYVNHGKKLPQNRPSEPARPT